MTDAPATAADERLTAWTERLAATHSRCTIRMTSRPAATFRGEISTVRLGEATLVDCACDPFAGRRGRREIAASDGAYAGVMLVRRGREAVACAGDSVVVSAGEAMFWDDSAVLDFEALAPLRKRTLRLPRELLEAVCPTFGRVAGRRLDVARGPGRLLAVLLDGLTEEEDRLDDEARRASSVAVLELLRAAIAADTRVEPQALRVGLLAHARQYVDRHLRDPALTPVTIAAAHAVSTRTLHLAFEPTGESVSAYVRRRRLERCHADLLGDVASITEIAHRWGFRDSAHFSRLFKERYGRSPTEVRRSRAVRGSASGVRAAA